MSIWWRPDRPAWWVGTLFAIGSILFLVPALAALGSTTDASTALGALCFLIGAVLLLPQAERQQEARA